MSSTLRKLLCIPTLMLYQEKYEKKTHTTTTAVYRPKTAEINSSLTQYKYNIIILYLYRFLQRENIIITVNI